MRALSGERCCRTVYIDRYIDDGFSSMRFFSALSSQFQGITVIHVQYLTKTQSFLELAFFKLRNQSLRILGY